MNIRVLGHQIDQLRPTEPEQRPKRKGSSNAPLAGNDCRTPYPCERLGAIGLTDQGLGRKGKSIKCKGRDLEKLQQDLVGGQRNVTVTCAKEDEARERHLQHDGTHHDVAVHRHHPLDAGRVKDARPVAPGVALKRPPAQPQSKRQPRRFSDQCRNRDAFHAPAKAQNEPEVENDVQPVHDYLKDQDALCSLQRNEPAGYSVKRNRGGRSPDANLQIARCQSLDLVRSGRYREGRVEKRHLEHDQHKARRQADHQGPHQQGAGFGRIPRTMRLRDHA